MLCPQCKSDNFTEGKVKPKEVIKFGVICGITLIVLSLALDVFAILFQWEHALNSTDERIRAGAISIFILPVVFWFIMRNRIAYECINCQHKWYSK
ncbi:hypothetical protein [Risungbinella massiliensis]|uniref:hypothetical protein n=1 Tax=Risungbinella massiliensis TaxID=1329796 RepID=UPI0005CB91A3|nr:hypothetical protein [Risungbinella massiliensis]